MQVILGRSTFPVDNVYSVEAYMTVYLNGNYEFFWHSGHKQDHSEFVSQGWLCFQILTMRGFSLGLKLFVHLYSQPCPNHLEP